MTEAHTGGEEFQPQQEARTMDLTTLLNIAVPTVQALLFNAIFYGLIALGQWLTGTM